jgi:DNA-binding transcriptional ArsR family regulator
VRVVDVSRPDEPLTVEVAAAPAAELLIAVLVACEDDLSDYDADTDRLTALRDRAGDETVARTLELVGGVNKAVIHLLGHVHRSGEPYAIDDLLGRLRDAEAEEVHLTLLGYHNRGARVTDAETMRRAIAGDAEARAATVAAADEWNQWRGAIAALLERDSDEVKAELVDLLAVWAEAFDGIAPEAMEPITRDAAAKRELASTLDPVRLVEVATNGVEFVRQPGIRRLALFPSYLLRPWVVLTEYDDTRIIVHPVADEHLEFDRTTPPPQLVKLYKALGDESRLRLLRLLADEGPIGLRDAADELGVAKSTAHHHLAVLRQAGLVLVRAEDETTYSLRREELPRCNDLLVRYLDTGAERPDAAVEAG